MQRLQLGRLIFGFVFIFFLFTQKSNAVVWQDSEVWSAEWEMKFSTWIENSFTSDYFVRGPYGRIATDCADAVYFARIIFSYENKLPFYSRILDVNDYSKKMFITNRNIQYDNLPENERLLKFLKLVSSYSGAHSLAYDTYPIKIDREHIVPGTVWLNGNGVVKTDKGEEPQPTHAALVKSVSSAGVISVYGSTSPADVRELKTITDFLILPKAEEKTGLRAWIWPQNYNLEPRDLPGYSEEQYSTSFARSAVIAARSTPLMMQGIAGWNQEIHRRLQVHGESKKDYQMRLAQNFCAYVKERVSIVNKAQELKANLVDNQCLPFKTWDEYSTQTRDSLIISLLKKLARESFIFGIVSKSNVEKLRPFLETCGTLEIAPGQVIDYVEVAQQVRQDRLNSDANQPALVRWGQQDPLVLGCKYE